MATTSTNNAAGGIPVATAVPYPYTQTTTEAGAPVYQATEVRAAADQQQQPLRGDFGYYTKAPQRIICQYCDRDVVTEILPVSGFGTNLCAITLCLFVCWPCCIVPYCVDDCKDVEHICPNCHRVVGVSRMM